MKNIIVFLIAILFFASCKVETKIDENYVIARFQENSEKINALEYSIERIDTLVQDGLVLKSTGMAIIEKDKKDKIFGFSFYAIKDDIPMAYIYDFGNGFEISQKDKTSEVYPGSYGFIGSPGGQMIAENVFRLDSIYKKVMLKEKETSYVLTYEFENDTVYNISDRIKTVELSKNDFSLIKITQTSNRLGNRSVSQISLSAIKINEDVTRSIKELQNEFRDYQIIQPEKKILNNLLSQKLPILQLPDLFDETNLVTINSDKLTLIDFWEVWCSPCIASFPKVENLKNTYASQLKVIGIVSEDKEKAIQLIKEKGTTFQNLVGNDQLQNTFGVKGFPSYFLIDRDGIIQREYFGFSEQIEIDIKKMITE